MLTLRSFAIQVLDLNEILVQWVVEPTDDDISKFRFTLGRSYSPGGPFERIANDFINTYQFIDDAEQMKSNWRKLYYQLTITDVRDRSVLVSHVAAIDDEPDFVLIEIRRRHRLYLERFVGISAAVFIARTFGQYCPQCWDQVKSRSNSSSCRTCFGVGFVGGFFPQINTFINFSPSPELVALLEPGEQHPNTTNLWMNFYPALSPRDIVVEHKSKRRWRVVEIGMTEHLRVLSRQIARIKEINRNDVEYKVPVVPFIPPPDTFLGFAPPEGSGLF